MLRAFGLQSRWEGLSVRGLLRRAAEPAAWLLAAAALTPQEKDMLRQRGLWPKQPREDV